MPPRGRKRKVEVAVEDVTRADTKKPKLTARERPAQNITSGLLSLPVEVFERIYDELLGTSRLITIEDVLENKPHLDDKFAYRTDALRALTQTCYALRVSCLPSYYEHVEACVVRGPGAWYKQLSERLERTSLMFVEHPQLAMHVQTVTVSLTRCSTNTVLPAFATCLKALPNLHTLRIMHAHSQMTTALKNAFENVSLPQIRTIILPTCAHNVLRACPNIVELICNEGDGSQLISAMAKASPNVEVVDNVCVWKEASGKRLLKAAPKLRELRVNQGELGPFMKSKYLTKICLTYYVQSSKQDGVVNDLAARAAAEAGRLEQAKNVLASSTAKSSKSVAVIFKVRDFEREASLPPEFRYEHFYKVGRTDTYEVA